MGRPTRSVVVSPTLYQPGRSKTLASLMTADDFPPVPVVLERDREAEAEAGVGAAASGGGGEGGQSSRRKVQRVRPHIEGIHIHTLLQAQTRSRQGVKAPVSPPILTPMVGPTMLVLESWKLFAWFWEDRPVLSYFSCILYLFYFDFTFTFSFSFFVHFHFYIFSF